MNEEKRQLGLADQLADLQETMQREKVELTPEVEAYLKENVEKIQGKLMNGEPVYPRDMKFIEEIKVWIENEIMIRKLKVRFESEMHLHEEVEWAKVEASLRENPKALWSINEMEKAGHEPDVYFSDDEGFDVGSCSKESPESGRNCDYRSAVEMAEAMKIELMTQGQYQDILQAKGKFDTKTRSWLKTPADIRKSGVALDGVRRRSGVFVVKSSMFTHGDSRRAFRGSLRVLWKKS